MAPGDPPKWSDGSAYRALTELDAAGFAWEWLRRDPRFRDEASEALQGNGARIDGLAALAFGLHAFEDPLLAAPDARPMWSASRYHWVLNASAEPAHEENGADLFDLCRFEHHAKVIVAGGIQHVLLTDGKRSIRVDVRGAALEGAPVHLCYELSGVSSLSRPLVVLRRLHAFCSVGGFARSLHPPFRRARRMILLLRAFDGLNAGASHLDLASALLSGGLDRRRWRIHSPSLRLQAQRLANGARQMADGAFWKLLG